MRKIGMFFVLILCYIVLFYGNANALGLGISQVGNTQYNINYTNGSVKVYSGSTLLMDFISSDYNGTNINYIDLYSNSRRGIEMNNNFYYYENKNSGESQSIIYVNHNIYNNFYIDNNTNTHYLYVGGSQQASQDFIKFYGGQYSGVSSSYTGDLYDYSNIDKLIIGNDVYDIGPPDITIINTGSIINLDNGIELQGIEVNKDYNLEYTITKYDENNLGIDVDSGTKGPFTSGINNIQFLNNNNFQFQALGLYDLDITLINVNDTNDIIRKFYNADYNYNGGYIDPGNINYSFFVNGYTFFENGFSLNNFIPTPSGGKLYFDIIAPNPTGTGTVNLQTNYFLPYDIDGNGYGIDSSVIVTYPYHQIAGTYQVRTVYDYDGEIIYPFGTDYNSYNISLAELPANYTPDELYVCDKNLDGVTDIGEAIACPFTIIKYYSEKIIDNVTKLKTLFRTIMNIGTNEIKTFSFVPSVHADFLQNLPDIGSQDNVFSKLYFFIKGFLYLVFLLLGIVLIIYLKKE